MPQIEGFRLFRNGISILDKGVFLIQINIGKVCTLYRSAGRCQFAGNQFQQGCLTAAVIPFNAQSAAAAQLKAEGSRPKVCVAVRVMKIDIPVCNAGALKSVFNLSVRDKEPFRLVISC